MIIIGLGNPGLKYSKTKHNVGYMFVNEIAKSYNVKFSLEKKFQCQMAEININGVKHYLVKPITYMNNSGISVNLIKDYFKIDVTELLVVHDDMDLPLGTIRIRKTGSSGGHNGIKSIIACLSTNEFNRIRIGIDHAKSDVIDYVLAPFNKQEKKILDETIVKAPNIMEDLVNHNIDYIMNKYN